MFSENHCKVFVIALGIVFFAQAPARAEVTLPDGQVVRNVDFEKHIVGVLGRSGCNLGSCHGAFQGKNGFRLSLFGYEAEKDGLSVGREFNSRRINLNQPDQSLLLLKATGQGEHAGGRRFSVDSWQYQLIREWIAKGAPLSKGSGIITGFHVTPTEIPFKSPGESLPLKVVANFADGTSETITSLCEYRSGDEGVAEVNSNGVVKGVRGGDAAIIVSHRGQVVAVRAMVPLKTATGFKYPAVPEVNFIDKIVVQKLKKLNMVPSGLSSDTEFLRRVTLDTVGLLPTPEEIRKFLEDKSANKREKKIDELLKHPMHAALWATKLSDITGNNTDALEQPQNLKSRRSQMWHDWLKKRIVENMPYDKLVDGILCSTSRDGEEPEAFIARTKKQDELLAKGFESDYANKPSLDLYWRRQQQVTVDQWGERTAAAFLGIRLECAQCHKHPFDRWTQVDYRSYANVFSQVAFGVSPEMKKLVDAENAERKTKAPQNNQLNQVREIYVTATNPRAMTHPETNGPLIPRALGGQEMPIERGVDNRKTLFNWMIDKNNPYFAQSFVNRIWGHYFGSGIVDPVDDFSQANPPSNPQLLQTLGKDFIQSGFNIREMEKRILLSRVYQLTYKPNESNQFDESNFSHSAIRPMMAEVVIDVLSQATGVEENFGVDAPKNSRAIEVGSSRVNSTVNYALRIFGRPPRTAACDCERSMEPALPQKLYLMADTALQAKIESQSNRIKTLLSEFKDDSQALDELFLATLSRFPSETEKQHFAKYKEKNLDRKTLFTDTLWALVNTKEFIFNH